MWSCPYLLLLHVKEFSLNPKLEEFVFKIKFSKKLLRVLPNPLPPTVKGSNIISAENILAQEIPKINAPIVGEEKESKIVIESI